MAKVVLGSGESVVAEAGAMIGMSTNVHMQTQSGGAGAGLKRLFGGESFFRNTFSASGGPGEVLLAPALCGDMAVLDVNPQGYFVQNSAYVASTPEVQVNTKVGGFKGFFAGAGMFVLQATSTGSGQILVGAFGGLQELECRGRLVIDTGHLVAWDAALSYTVGKSGAGWIGSFLSGEGLVCHFTGRGRIWIQSRNPRAYGTTVGRLLPPRRD
jgi:uncharacterized protein (TIGR00266 family)